MPGRARKGGSTAGASPLSTGGHVVLGLLLDGPASGWELAQVADRSIAHFWPLTRAHIYAELPKLAERGYATAVEVTQTRVPNKRVYTATEAGRAAFVDWLAEVDLVEERGRQPLQLQLFFAAHTHPDRLRDLLDTWAARAAAAEHHCREILAAKGVDVDRLSVLVLDEGASGHPAPAGGGPARQAHGGRPTGDRGARPGSATLATLDARGMTALFGLRRAQADQVWLSEVRGALDAG